VKISPVDTEIALLIVKKINKEKKKALMQATYIEPGRHACRAG